MGQNGWINDGHIRQKAHTQSSRSTSPSSRGQLKSKGHGKLSITRLCRSGDDLNCFFAQLFLQISSVFTGQSQKCVKNRKPFTDRTEQPRCGRTIELLIRSKRDQDRSAFGLWWPCSQRSSIANNIENELKSYHNKTDKVNFVWKQDSWMMLKSDSIHDERHWRFNSIQYSGLSWIHHSERRFNITTERMDPREHQNWGPYWK